MELARVLELNSDGKQLPVQLLDVHGEQIAMGWHNDPCLQTYESFEVYDTRAIRIDGLTVLQVILFVEIAWDYEKR